MELVGSDLVTYGNDKDYLTTRVAYKLGLKGPALNVATACSTALVAVGQSCQALLTYQCDVALAGGVSVRVPQQRGYYYDEGNIGSPDGHTRTFDARGEGTIFSNGVGVVVLKRLEEAVKDGDQIFAVIKGVGLNNDGSQRVSFGAPGVEGQSEAIAMAHALAGFDAETISYVEAHGTATPLGDPIEIAGLTKAFRMGTDAKQFCAIGSVKTNIGHLDVAAGAAGLIKDSFGAAQQKNSRQSPFHQAESQVGHREFAVLCEYIAAGLENQERCAAPRGHQLVWHRRNECAFGFGRGAAAFAVGRVAPMAIANDFRENPGSIGTRHREFIETPGAGRC